MCMRTCTYAYTYTYMRARCVKSIPILFTSKPIHELRLDQTVANTVIALTIRVIYLPNYYFEERRCCSLVYRLLSTIIWRPEYKILKSILLWIVYISARAHTKQARANKLRPNKELDTLVLGSNLLALRAWCACMCTRTYTYAYTYIYARGV